MSEYIDARPQRRKIHREIANAILERSFTKERAQELAGWIDAADPGDIVVLVDGLVASGLAMAAIKPLVSALLNLFHRPLEAFRYQPGKGGAGILDAIVREDRQLVEILAQLKPLVARLCATGLDSYLYRIDVEQTLGLAQKLESCGRLFTVKENILFPQFESRFPEYRCVSVLWSIHNDARRDLSEFRRLVTALPSFDDPGEWRRQVAAVSGRLFFDLSTIAFRDECIFLPFAASIFGREVLESMGKEAQEFGFECGNGNTEAGYSGTSTRESDPLTQGGAASSAPGKSQTAIPGRPVDLGAGSLKPEVLAAMFRSFHQDMTFVDADDRVAFFTEGPHRVFPRSRSIIGRKVADCHPAESVGRVLRIVASFRTGEKDSERFWLRVRGRMVHIEYLAIRDADGRYLGTLEVSEDIEEKRSLEGEKRL